MTDRPWSKFFWADWESDEALRQCSLAAQGLWMRMLCICAKGDPPGYLAINGQPLDSSGVAKSAGVSVDEAEALMVELEQWGVFSRDRKGRIYSRRMIKDVKKSKEGQKHVKKRWSQATDNKEEKSEPNRGACRDPSSRASQRPEARGQKEKTPSGSKRKVALPDGVPNAEDRQKALEYWRSHGLEEIDVEVEADSFRAHHQKKGDLMVDWHAAWRTWYVNAVRYRQKRGGAEKGQHEVRERENAVMRWFEWKNPKTGQWEQIDDDFAERLRPDKATAEQGRLVG